MKTYYGIKAVENNFVLIEGSSINELFNNCALTVFHLKEHAEIFLTFMNKK